MSDKPDPVGAATRIAPTGNTRGAAAQCRAGRRRLDSAGPGNTTTAAPRPRIGQLGQIGRSLM
jgi:hypothetical protein